MHRQLAIPSTGHEISFTLPDNALNIRLLCTSGKGAELLLDELRLGHNGISASNEPSDTTNPLRPDVIAAKRAEYETATPVWDPAKWSTGHVELIAGAAPKTGLYARNPACRQYELNDSHFDYGSVQRLGNIRVVISGIKKSDILPGTTTPANYRTEVLVMRDYYAFGMLHPVMQFVGDDYRYGFNGMEMDNEISGEGNGYTAEFWEMNPRISRRWNQDPKPNPSISNYAIYANNPIWFVDPLGDTTNYYTNKGKFLGTLYGGQGLNDRTINEGQFNKFIKEKYLFENVTVGNYNMYFHDPTKRHEDFLNTDQMEEFLNNQNNVLTEVLDLNGELGFMARAVYAEVRSGDANAKSIVAESIRNRTQLPKGSYERADGTYTDIVNKFYDVSKPENGSYNVFKNPYNYARKNDAEMVAWKSSVGAALQAHNGYSNVGLGVIFYHSKSSSHWDDDYVKINLGFTVNGVKGLWKK